MEKAIMHCHHELEADLHYESYITDKIMAKWFNDSYSISKHLYTLYSIARGINAKNIVEIGFGRSSFVLARAAAENKGKFITCDTRDFSYLLNDQEKKVTTFIHNKSDFVWEEVKETGIDFAFLDYFSDGELSPKFVIREIKKCINLMKTNGIIVIHDTVVEKYAISKVMGNKKLLGKRKDLEIISLPYNYGLGLIRITGKSDYGRLDDQFNKKKMEL